MKPLFVIPSLLLLWFDLKAQIGDQDAFVVVTIEKKTSSALHPIEFDYWLISKSKWNKPDEAIIPLYIDGFSQTDVDECCLSDTLILFNSDSQESFVFQESFKKSLSELRDLISKTKLSVETLKKKWSDGYTEEISIFLTPIRGSFCICEIKHKDDNSKIGYSGKVAVPSGDFKSYKEFSNSKEFYSIKRYDYSKLPFLALYKMQ